MSASIDRVQARAGDAFLDPSGVPPEEGSVRAPRRSGLLRRTWHRSPSIVIGGVIVLILLFIAIAAPWLGTVDPTALAPSQRLREPSGIAWFGRDPLGRDVYSRVLYGTRVSLAVGLGSALLATTIGAFLGLVAGFIRPVEGLLMRIMDGLMAIPSILIAVALIALVRGSIVTVIVAITIAEIPRVARLVRGVVLSLREMPFVEGAIASGTRTPGIVLRHILPNTLAPLSVQATYICATAMLIEAGLSFIGAGVPPAIPSWGNVMAEGRALWQLRPHIIFFPALFLSIAVLGVNVLGDGLRDALDPRAEHRS